MSDFIFSNHIIEEKRMKQTLHSIYRNDLPQVSYFHGSWGSLGVTKNTYNGYEPYETEEFIGIVIGGPLLTFRDNSFIHDEHSNEGTKAIFQRWRKNEIVWDNDINGPYAILIINKIESEVFVVTDIMSYVPVYESRKDNSFYLSSHVDMLANITDKNDELDEVSLVDFILHGTVTYPYTAYKDIYQIQPASEHFYHNNNIQIKAYWEPYEVKHSMSINNTVKAIRKELESYIKLLTSETTNIAQFISGGEDSRTLSALLGNIHRDSYIYLDGMNREGKLARKIASKYNANFNLTTREEMHYLHILEDCSDLIGAGAEYHHAHTYGFHKTLNKYDGVFGGLFSDALLKGARIKKTKLTKKLTFLPDKKEVKSLINVEVNKGIFSTTLKKELIKRRNRHLEFIKIYRKESAEEWFELWPSSMNRNIPNIYANRRLFKSYEPFMSNEIVKMSASIPQDWKLNRYLFHKVAKPYLKKSKWVFHGDGWLPYFSYHVNSVIRFFTWTYRQFGRRLGFVKGNQGPWAEWKEIVNDEKWQYKIQEYNNVPKNIPLNNIFKEMNVKDKNISVLQFISLTQTLYQLKRGDYNENPNKKTT